MARNSLLISATSLMLAPCAVPVRSRLHALPGSYTLRFIVWVCPCLTCNLFVCVGFIPPAQPGIMLTNWIGAHLLPCLAPTACPLLQHMLPNFNECWWDSWVLDVLVCNSLGGCLTHNALEGGTIMHIA